MDMDFNIDIFINFHDRSRFICLITLFLNKGDIRPHFIPPPFHILLPLPTVMKNPGFIIGSVSSRICVYSVERSEIDICKIF